METQFSRLFPPTCFVILGKTLIFAHFLGFLNFSVFWKFRFPDMDLLVFSPCVLFSWENNSAVESHDPLNLMTGREDRSG